MGRDLPWIFSSTGRWLFQSTRPRGARLSAIMRLGNEKEFQSTRPRGARPRRGPGFVHHFLFQSTRPRGARQAGHPESGKHSCSFNPRARVGRDLYNLSRFGSAPVSIHAPAWGATAGNRAGVLGFIQFQSTRPRGARQPHHNSLRDKDFFRVTREPMLSLDPKGTGQVAATQKPMKSISC